MHHQVDNGDNLYSKFVILFAIHKDIFPYREDKSQA
jgi:hypothetical protein